MNSNLNPNPLSSALSASSATTTTVHSAHLLSATSPYLTPNSTAPSSPASGNYFSSLFTSSHPDSYNTTPPLPTNHRPVRTPSNPRRTTPLARTVYPVLGSQPQSQSPSRTVSESSSASEPDPLSIAILTCSPAKHSAPSPTSPTARSGSSPSKRNACQGIGPRSNYPTHSASSSMTSSSTPPIAPIGTPNPFSLLGNPSASTSAPTLSTPDDQTGYVSSLTLPQPYQSSDPISSTPFQLNAPSSFASSIPSKLISPSTMSGIQDPTLLTQTTSSITLPGSTPPGSANSTATTAQSRYPSITPSHFKSVSATQLIDWLKNSPDDLLVLDVRNVGAYSRSKIKDSVGFNLPTTLLKRPLYGVDRIEANLDSPSDKARFSRFRSAVSLPQSSQPLGESQDACLKASSTPPLKRIVTLDAESSVSTLPSQHPLALILRKFEAAGFKGELNWLWGGFNGFSRYSDAIDLIENATTDRESDLPVTSSGTTGDSANHSLPSQNSLRMSLSLPPSLTTSPTTATSTRPPLNGTRPARQRPAMSIDMFTRTPAALDPRPTDTLASGSTPRVPQHQSTSHYATSRARPASRARAAVNPFFDNIRQLNEHLSLDVSLKNLTPIRLPKLKFPERDMARLPRFYQRLLEEDEEARARRLAHEFHDIEMAEQRRLQDVMRWHSSQRAEIRTSGGDACLVPVAGPCEGGVLDGASEHPFSISAGVELGYKNRYKNIWPWEHARIRLNGQNGHCEGTDYVNASLIKFELGDAKRVSPRSYIATQGPLASTFDDFWSVVCQQDVGLIVMLTKRHEAGREKCGDYLRSGKYGDIVISIEPEEGVRVTEEEESDDFFGFAASVNEETYMARREGEATPNRSAGRAVVITTIRLSRVTRPELPARRIKHVQYRNWPDFDVPPEADELLELVSQCKTMGNEVIEVNEQIQSDYRKQTDSSSDVSDGGSVIGRGAGPVVVHCSAGVGRTGSFIAVDVMTEVLKAMYVEEDGVVSETLVVRKGRKWMDIESPKSETGMGGGHGSVEFRNGTGNGMNKRIGLPSFLETEYCDCLSEIPSVLQDNPILPLVNEMREQRMSMVANYRQYVFVYEVLLSYLLRELKIEVEV
ncbi:hypothetical protein DFH28DRAFT_958323 [Melampsora americana]|nr:hypothetical protein DFH28DRAFT_958323 [Melampsora americana]